MRLAASTTVSIAVRFGAQSSDRRPRLQSQSGPPDDDGSEHCGGGELVVAGCDGSSILESAEHAFDEIALEGDGRPRASTIAWIFVVRPPRERPIACASALLFHPPPNGAPWLSCRRWLDLRQFGAAPAFQTAAATGRAWSSGESDCKSSSADHRRIWRSSVSSPIRGLPIWRSWLSKRCRTRMACHPTRALRWKPWSGRS